MAIIHNVVLCMCINRAHHANEDGPILLVAEM